jgi:hypothetical protein
VIEQIVLKVLSRSLPAGIASQNNWGVVLLNFTSNPIHWMLKSSPCSPHGRCQAKTTNHTPAPLPGRSPVESPVQHSMKNPCCTIHVNWGNILIGLLAFLAVGGLSLLALCMVSLTTFGGLL